MNVFNECKRVLKKTGSLWVNIGDTYSAKSLIGIPERLCIAMTDAGFIRRNTIIWHKPNCMPSSAKDRFTIDFEYFYFFTKSQRYYFDTQYEPHKNPQDDIRRLLKNKSYTNNKVNNRYFGTSQLNCKKTKEELEEQFSKGRLKRCVWTIATTPLKEAHFATFPEKLIETPIKACCPPDGIVLDPFAGAGTTLLVAKKLGRRFIGIELNEDYVKIANKRLQS